MGKWQTGLRVLMISLVMALVAPPALSAEGGGRRGVATVIFCGLGGAVVGLSTLSFYGKPQDHTGNIYAGLGLGLIIGAAYVLSGPSPESIAQKMEKAPQLELSRFDDPLRSARSAADSFEVASYRLDF